MGKNALLFSIGLILCIFASSHGFSKQYEIFDGRHYNGKFYARIDIIDAWEKPAHMEFHIYAKREYDIAVKVIERNGKTVMLLNYFIRSRQERLCRSVIVTKKEFQPEGMVYLYRDESDPDMDNIWVAASPVKETVNLKSYHWQNYTDCTEKESKDSITNKDNSKSGVFEFAHPTVDSDSKPQKHKTNTDQLKIDYENQSMPFSF